MAWSWYNCMLRIFKNCYKFAVQSYNPAKNYYKILEVDEAASAERIKTSYKTLVKKYHPDLNKGKEEQFKEVNEAYQVLSDQETKRQYDVARQAPPQQQTQHPFHSANQNQYSGNPYQGFPGGQWSNTKQQTHYQQVYRSPNGQTRYHSSHPFHQQNQGQYGWRNRDQWLYELYRQQQQEFMKQYQKTQRERFERASNRSSRSPIQEQYMRRYMEDLMWREEARKAEEQIKAEQERAQREEMQRLQREYAENTRKLKTMAWFLLQGIKDIGKALWQLWLELKRKK